MKKKIRILSLDGGGMRGIIPATVLEYIEKKLQSISNNPNARLADYFDLMAGTSTGGILTCFYLMPNPNQAPDQPISKFEASTALEFYSQKGHSIFNGSKKFAWFGMRQLFDATAYSANAIEKIFKTEFGDTEISSLLKPCLIPTFNLEAKTTHFFSSREHADKMRKFYVRDVARSTSAAPTYFPPAKIKNLATGSLMINIDGGVFANNPTMCAYSESRDYDFAQNPKPSADDMLILSIGTGGGALDISNPKNAGKWGVINWAKSMPSIMMDGALDTVDFQMNKIFGTLPIEDQEDYVRVDVPSNKRKYSPDMANATPQNIEALKVAGKETLQAALDNGLNDFIQKLVDNDPG